MKEKKVSKSHLGLAVVSVIIIALIVIFLPRSLRNNREALPSPPIVGVRRRENPISQYTQIQAKGSQVPGKTIKVDSLFLEKKGFVVVQRLVGANHLSEPIGISNIIEGQEDQLEIDLDEEAVKGEELVLGVYFDNGNGAFSFTDPDEAAVDTEGKFVLVNVKIEESQLPKGILPRDLQ